MENGEHGEPRGIVKNAQHILVMTSAKQQLLGRIFSTHSPLIRMALTRTSSDWSRGFSSHYHFHPVSSSSMSSMVFFSSFLALYTPT